MSGHLFQLSQARRAAGAPAAALGADPEHDETLFIVIHQVYELWFKELLHELDYLVRLLERQRLAARAAHAQARADHSQGGGGADRRARNHDAARVPFVPRAAGVRQRVSVAISSASWSSARCEERRRAGALPGRRRGANAGSSARFAAPTLWDAFLHFLSLSGCTVPAAALNARRDARPSRRPRNSRACWSSSTGAIRC